MKCETKGLDCRPVQRNPVFRHGSTANLDANFGEDQTWVNSRPRSWRQPTRSARLSRSRSSPTVLDEDLNESSITLRGQSNGPQRQAGGYSITDIFGSVELNENLQNESSNVGSFTIESARPVVCSPGSPSNVSNSSISSSLDNGIERNQLPRAKSDNLELGSHTATVRSVDTSYSVNQGSTKGSSNVQEACLLRYFIEELSPWVSHIIFPRDYLTMTFHSLIIAMSDATFN